MKKIALIAALGLMGMGSAMAQTTTTGNFNVTVNLQARCQLAANGGTTLAFGSYTAFTNGAISTAPISYTLSCTRNFGAPVVSFDVINGGTDAAADGSGVVGGLRYTITSNIATVVAGNAATASPADVGSADTRVVTLTGNMAGGQVGDALAATSQNRILTITY